MIDEHLKDECQNCFNITYIKAFRDTTDNDKTTFICAECAEQNPERFKR